MSQNTLHEATQSVILSEVETSQTKEEEKNTKQYFAQKSEALNREILHCAPLRSERQQNFKVLQEKK